MYNDRNRQICKVAHGNPSQRPVAGIPRLDNDRGGRRCDGSLPHSAPDRREHSCDLPDRLQGHPLAMVYSPYQHFRDIYTPDVALDRGTLFAELDLPFEGSGNKRNGGCIR